MILRKPFKVTGVANEIAYDQGLPSTATEKARLLSVHLLITGYADNEIQGYHERAKAFGIPDRLLDVETDAYTEAEAKPGARINELEIGLEIPVGETFKVAIKCGATVKDVYGFYAYELMT
jgi:hypothetical protein